MLKGAIFDLGDTLVHLTVSWEEVRDSRVKAIHEALQDRGITLDLNDLEQQYLKLHSEERDYTARTRNEIDAEQSFTELLDRLNIEARQRPAITDLVRRSFELEVKSWALFPGIETMLEEVRDLGLKMGLLSNARSDWAVKEIVNRLDLKRHFDVILTSAAIGIMKPRPEPFHQMLTLLGVDASETVMIGNSMEADIAGARSLSIKTIHVTYGENDERPADPDVTIHRVSEILPAIRLMMTTS